MNLSNNNYDHYLLSAKRLYKEEKSYPGVYRKLIKEISADEAICILNELKQLTGQNESDPVVIH